jgi:hypothetical protein
VCRPPSMASLIELSTSPILTIAGWLSSRMLSSVLPECDVETRYAYRIGGRKELA